MNLFPFKNVDFMLICMTLQVQGNYLGLRYISKAFLRSIKAIVNLFPMLLSLIKASRTNHFNLINPFTPG